MAKERRRDGSQSTRFGPEKAHGILFFLGCDIISSNKSAWKSWDVCDEVSNTFAKLSECPSAVEDSYLQALERFVVIMYDRSSNVTTVNKARLDLYARKQRQYDLIPPTQAALKELAKRAGYVWGQALE